MLGENDLAIERETRNRRVFGPPVKIKPASITIHEKFNPDNVTAGYDIALIRLERAIPVLAYRLIYEYYAFPNTTNNFTMVTPVCLPWNSSKDIANDVDNKTDLRALGKDRSSKTVFTIAKNVSSIGWGIVTNDLRITARNFDRYGAASGRMQEVRVDGLPAEKCKQVSLFKNLQPEIQFCAGTEFGKAYKITYH